MTGRFAVRFKGAVGRLAPGYFAFVMATGIISVGLKLEHHVVLSRLLFALAAAGYVVLLALTAWRLWRYRAAVRADFSNPSRAFEFFTFVAGTNVLATRIALEEWFPPVFVLLVVALAAWLVLGYALPWLAVLGRHEHPSLKLANGTWFIWSVASESIAVVAAVLEPHFPALRDALAAVAVLGWAVGVFLYAVAGLTVALRLLLYEVTPSSLGPPYWVAMGAAAITVVAGARIVDMSASPMADSVRDLVAAAAVMFWVFASWLIPVLVAVAWWRHVRRKVSLRYESALWGTVFPLGMYAVAGIYLGRADHLPIAEWVGAVELWVAFGVWVVVAAEMVWSVTGVLTGRRSRHR